MRLQGKTALITGAGSGMGRLAAEVFASEGAAVVATDISSDGLAETVERVRNNDGEILGVAGDVSRSDDVQRWVDEAVKAYGTLNILYNNAGVFPDEDGSVTDFDEAVFERVLNVNLKGVSLCCKFAVPALIKAGGGSIVNVASFVALMGCTVPQDAYTASKGAVLAPYPVVGRPVWQAQDPRERDLSGTDRDAADARVPPRRRGARTPPQPDPARTIWSAGGRGERCALPGVGRIVLDHGHHVRG